MALMDPDNPTLPHEWSVEALSAKAQLYIEQMMAVDRDSWQYCLWSCLALEHAARAALSNIDPLLQAGGSGNGAELNMVYASGRRPKATKFKPQTRDLSSTIRLLNELLDDLTADLVQFCELHNGRRNLEIHTGSSQMAGTSYMQWLPRFYETMEVLLDSFDESLESWLGKTEYDLGQDMIAAAADESAKAIAAQVSAFEKVWNDKDEAERETLSKDAAAWATREKGHKVECPACHSPALLSGTPTGPPQIEAVDGEIREKQEHVPTSFQCVACKLKFSGLAKLNAVGLGETYPATYHYTPAEYYGEEIIEYDPYAGYDDDNNEPW